MNTETYLKSLIHESPDNIDPLDLAEKITGKSYKEDEDTAKLGMYINILKSQRSAQLADAFDDTKFSMLTNAYKECVERIGFELIHKVDFQHEDTAHWTKPENEVIDYYKDKNIVSLDKIDDNKYKVVFAESQYFYWFKGILLVWDTFEGHRNSAKCYLNLKLKNDHSDAAKLGHVSYSWHYIGNNEDQDYAFKNFRSRDFIVVADFDGREFLRKQIQRIERDFEIMTVWKKQPFLWFCHHQDERRKDYEAVNAEKMALLPKEIQQAIGCS